MKIAALGGYGVGHSMRVPRAPEAGESLSDGVLSSGHGGKGSNQAVAARRLGATATMLTAVGHDDAATAAFAMWQEEGVDASSVLRLDAATMAGFILVEEGGENRIVIAPGALGELTVAHVEHFATAIRSSDLLLVSLEIPIPVAEAAMRIAKDAGVRVILNPAPATGVTTEMCRLSDVLTPNLTEAMSLIGAGTAVDPVAAATMLRELSGADVVMTLGGEGSIVATQSGIERVPAIVPERVVDTTGAGDSFNAALAVALLRTGSLITAARYAARAGAHTVAHAEVIPALPRTTDLPDPHHLTEGHIS